MHILITGGAGFIGSNLIKFFLKDGHKVHVVDDLSTGNIDNITPFINHSEFTFDKANLLTWKGLDNATNWADRIYHMAAVVGVFRVLKDPISVLSTNISGCERLLRSLSKSHWQTKLVIASTSEVYGNQMDNTPLHENMDLLIHPGHNSRWNYSISKIADEAFALSYVREHNLDITVVRFFNVIGENQTGKYGMVVPRFVKQAVSGEPITVYGDGSQVRSFMDIRDCIYLMHTLLENELGKGEVVNIGASNEITILELAKMVKQRAKSKSEIVHIPYDEAYGANFEEIYHRKPDLTKLKKLIGKSAKFSLKESIDFLIEARQKKIKDK